MMGASSTESLKVMRRCLFLVSIPLFFVTFALPVLSKSLGASAIEIGGLFSLFTFSILLMRPVIGIGIDKYGRRRFFLLSILFYIGAYAGYAFATDIEAMYVARFFQGFGASLLLLSVDTMTADLVPAAERGQAMGENIEIQTRSSFVGALIGFSLVGAMPIVAWMYSFGLFTVLAIFALGFAVFKLPETRIVIEGEKLKPFVATKDIKKLMLIFVLIGAANALIMPIYMIYLQDVYSPVTALLSWAFLPAAFVAMILPSRFGKFADKRNPATLMSIGIALAGVFYLLMSFTQGFWLMVAVYTLSGLAWALIGPCRKALTASATDASGTARAFGLAEMAFGAGATAGPLIGGYLYDVVGQTTPFIFNGVLMLLTAVLSYVLIGGDVQGSSEAKG